MKEPSIRHNIPVNLDSEQDRQKIFEEPVEEACLDWAATMYHKQPVDVYFPYNCGNWTGD